jgi:hypothetical protein
LLFEAACFQARQPLRNLLSTKRGALAVAAFSGLASASGSALVDFIGDTL